MSQLKTFFAKRKEVVFVYLFGSQVRGDALSSSDVDLAVFLESKTSRSDLSFFDQRLVLIAQLTRLLGREAEVIILNTAPPFLRYVILQEGRLVFERDHGRRVDFELKITNEYFDFQPYRELYHRHLLTSK